MRRFAALLGAFLALAGAARALDPQPRVLDQPGLHTWTLEADHPLLKLEKVLEDLRSPDERTVTGMLEALGVEKIRSGRSLAWPRLVQPIQAQAQFLSQERRKMALLTAPLEGRQRWLAVLLRQEGSGEAYWRARQVFLFDTDPVAGLGQSFPDVLGDGVRFWRVEHQVKDDVYGHTSVSSLLRYDERGRLRLAYQEPSHAYRGAQFTGQALGLDASLAFRGDQKIRRTVTLKTWPWMRGPEFTEYRYVQPSDAKPAKVETVSEVLAWNPVAFDFYGPEQELDKLVNARSPWLRSQAALRLGRTLKTSHPQLAEAVWKDRDSGVRIRVAMALGAIGDPAALPAVRKALQNLHIPDEEREALQGTEARLQAAKPLGKAGAKARRAKAAPAKAAAMPDLAPAAEGSPAVPTVGPKITGKK